MFVILFVLRLLVIQCGCHWSQVKATYLLTYYNNRYKQRCLRVGLTRGLGRVDNSRNRTAVVY